MERRGCRAGDRRGVRVPVEDGRTRWKALERPEVERLGEPGLGEHESDTVRRGGYGGHEAVGAGRLGGSTRAAGDLLVDAGQSTRERRAPTLSAAETAVGALSSPESSVGCVTESVKATSRRPVPAT